MSDHQNCLRNRKDTIGAIPRRAVATFLALLAMPASAITGPCQANLMISQVYGAGGNVGAVYTYDFVELHNPGINAVSLAGYAIQYTTASGTSWQVNPLPGVSIAAGGYFLIQAGSDGNMAQPLPTPDAFAMSNLAFAAGKIALTSSTTPLSGSCPLGSTVDFVGYGATADCFEGMVAAPTTGNGVSIKRTNDACGDTNFNSVDFAPVMVQPRNSAAAPQVCACTVNETDVARELDFCNLQFPQNFLATSGDPTSPIFAQVYETGVTESAGANPAIRAQIGYGPQSVDPATQAGFSWFTAGFNVQVMNNDEYQASFVAPVPGTYGYTSRFSLDGVNWTYCDMDGAGSNGGMTFSSNQLGTMTVVPGGGGGMVAPQITSPNTATFNLGVNSNFALTATGSPVPGFSVSGALPAGVNFNGMNGQLFGTPGPGTTGGYPLTFTATNGVPPNATQNFALVVATACTLDADGNGTVDALTDGLMLLRAMFGLTGTAVTNNSVGDSPGRATWTAIRAYLNAHCGTTFAP